jgi:hypothetical protein
MGTLEHYRTIIKEDIVPAFHSPYLRHVTEYALA